jgi:hypothetical protein
VDSEQVLKVELRRALDEVLPPAPWLEAAVKDDLRRRRSHGWAGRGPGKSQRRPVRWHLSPVQLAAGVLIVVLAGAALAAFLEVRNLAPRSEPAALDLARYQAMVSSDVNRLIISNSASGMDCTTVQSNCKGPGEQLLGAFQRFLDDLNRSQPPTSLAVTNGLMRRHLAAAIADINGVFAAYAAKDQVALDRDNYLLSAQGEWLSAITTGIAKSRQGTVASYIDSVQAAKQGMTSCNGCRPVQLAGQDCAEIQTVLCEADVVYAKLDIEALESALTTVTAPSSLADQDALLQRDLAEADAAVLALASAQLTGDQSGFITSRVLLAQKLLSIDADLAGILGAS